MQEPERLPSLEQLGEDIRQLQEKAGPTPKSGPSASGQALGVGLELVSGVVVGVALGLALDKWLGTSPLLLLLCSLLGAAGGFLTIYRTVGMADSEKTDETSKEE